MTVLRALTRGAGWLVIDLPCRFWLSADDHAPRPVWVYPLGWVAVIGAAGLGGSALALAHGTNATDGLLEGAQTGMLAVLAWVVYAALLLLALWVRGVSPAALLNHAHPRAAGPARHGRTASESGWRRPGEPYFFPVRRRTPPGRDGR